MKELKFNLWAFKNSSAAKISKLFINSNLNPQTQLPQHAGWNLYEKMEECLVTQSLENNHMNYHFSHFPLYYPQITPAALAILVTVDNDKCLSEHKFKAKKCICYTNYLHDPINNWLLGYILRPIQSIIIQSESSGESESSNKFILKWCSVFFYQLKNSDSLRFHSYSFIGF